ncbi:MAG TPA: hypothetical protein VGC29_04250 [Flavisolibacter sp.]
MKSSFKRLLTLNKTALLRGFIFSIAFIAFYFLVLYILINSPA